MESVGGGGVCVARHEGQVVFVRGALPGERVRAHVIDATSRFLRAEVVAGGVIAPSPDRVVPPCPLARVELPREQRCGGCDWQHASLPAQRELKRSVVAQHLSRLAGLDWPGSVEAVPGEDGLGWRTRMQFAVASPGGELGLRAARSHHVLPLAPVGGCRIAHPAMAEVVATARFPGCQAVEITVDADAQLGLVITAPAQTPLPPSLGKVSRVKSLDSRGKPSPQKGEGAAANVQMAALGRRWQVELGGFWQVHLAAADTLAAAVSQSLQGLELAGATASDLYSGSGLFTQLLTDAVGPQGRVVAVESSPEAVANARVNLAAYPQVHLVAGRVEQAALPQQADVIVLDPPRAGAGASVVQAIAACQPQRVIYVSCDPATLARDLATFATLSYGLHTLRAFDLFPMTAHVECVAVLDRG